MKKYSVYYETKNLPEGSDCPHFLDEYDTLEAAYMHLQAVKDKGLYQNACILKNITFKVSVTEVEESQ